MKDVARRGTVEPLSLWKGDGSSLWRWAELVFRGSHAGNFHVRETGGGRWAAMMSLSRSAFLVAGMIKKETANLNWSEMQLCCLTEGC